ncbi:MAG: hypothetical protein M1453_03210 [Acidobacteria bacterium]|nr:hypothetical protein [Acidobacteriota bacterium]
MKLEALNSDELIVILITLSPIIWLVRWAVRQKPRNYFLILGTVTILLCFAFALFSKFLSSAWFGAFVTIVLVIALATVCIAAGSWGTKKKSWKPVIYFGLVNVALLVLFIVLAPGTTFGPFLIVGVAFLLNTLATIGLAIRQIVLAMRRAR